jgi:hypothetical protein
MSTEDDFDEPPPAVPSPEKTPATPSEPTEDVEATREIQDAETATEEPKGEGKGHS